MRLEIGEIVLVRITVFTLILKDLSITQIDNGVLVTVANSVLIGVGSLGIIENTITFTLVERYVGTQDALFFRRETSIALFVQVGGIIILADSIFLVCPLDACLDTTRRKHPDEEC